MRWRSATARRVVFVVRDGKAVAVPVTPGIKIGELTAITGDGQDRRERRCSSRPLIFRRGLPFASPPSELGEVSGEAVPEYHPITRRIEAR